VARYTENLAVDKPFADTWRAVHMALVAHNWNIVNVRDNTFYVRERLSFTHMLWRNPCRFALHVRREDETRSVVYLIGSTLGFGPLPNNRIRQVAAVLKGQLLGVIARIEPEPSAEDARPQ
jgi:hypothetical protein